MVVVLNQCKHQTDHRSADHHRRPTVTQQPDQWTKCVMTVGNPEIYLRAPEPYRE